jgi:hypothetical protein
LTGSAFAPEADAVGFVVEGASAKAGLLAGLLAGCGLRKAPLQPQASDARQANQIDFMKKAQR